MYHKTSPAVAGIKDGTNSKLDGDRPHFFNLKIKAILYIVNSLIFFLEIVEGIIEIRVVWTRESTA